MATSTKKPATKRQAAKADDGVQKKPLTVAQAAEQWAAATGEIERQKALIGEAAPVLVKHFEKTGRRTYKDLIAYVQAPARTILDQPKVKEFLGARLPEFQKRSTPKPSLSLLEKPEK
jgi:hypothetical protein